MAGDLLPPELAVPNLPPEEFEAEPEEVEEPILEIPMVVGGEEEMNEEDVVWDGMESADVSTVTVVIGPNDDLMEDDDEGTGVTEWERDQWLMMDKLDPLHIETNGYS